MISLKKDGRYIYLEYQVENADPEWVDRVASEGGEIPLKNTYHFQKDDLVSIDTEEEDYQVGDYVFLFATKQENGYFKIEGRKLGIKQDVYIHESIKVTPKFFSVAYNMSVFKKIADIVTEDLYIGGANENAILTEDFSKLLASFPTTYELKKYTGSRLSTVLGTYFDTAASAHEKYIKHMNKKISAEGEDLTDTYKEVEIEKYQTTLTKLIDMLENSDMYSEHQWQKEILDIILLIFPKYVYVFENAVVKDDYYNTDRKLDLILVDAEGNIDVVEIKKPFDDALVTTGVYRDNHVPRRELSGSIVQLEKYIFHLNKSGKRGENKLTQQYKTKLPAGFEIKITNPTGLAIVGRSSSLSPEQKADFEVIKRKYKNIVDIITYDDLLDRLKRMAEAWSKR